MPKKKPVRKQTSARVSSDAASIEAKLPKRGIVVASYRTRYGTVYVPLCKAAALRSCLMSLVGQDETPGQSPKTPKRRARK